jgi:hypothetical protein
MSPLPRIALTATVLGLGLCAAACLDRDLKAINPCLVSSVSRRVSVTNIDKVDLLFSVDNSASMAEEQTSLKQQFPRMISILTTGQRTPDDPTPFPAAKDLHLGVVSSDMGALGQTDVEGCSETGGDDGKLQNTPRGMIGCQAVYPSFLSYIAGPNTPEQIATDFGCIAELGTGGCGYEQQLESAFKALWPSQYADQRGNARDNPFQFLGLTPQQMLGRGDLEAPDGSQGFIRPISSRGLSLVAIVVVSDEEDCSASNTSHFANPTGPTDPLFNQGPQVRCFNNKQNLYDVSRYIDGFKELRPGYEQLVVFAAIVGVPANLVDEEARTEFDLTDPERRTAYYARIMDDPRMQERVINQRNPQNAQMAPSCTHRDRTGQFSSAFPPRRIVEVARGFDENGVIQSICQDDFGPAMDAIIEVIAKQLGAVCLPRPLVRQSDGLVSCNVIWELPRAGTQPRGTPTECADLPFLKQVAPGTAADAINVRGGANCVVDQLPVLDAGRTPGGAGWYYDNFSDEVGRECPGTLKQRVSFTQRAKPNTGVVVRLDCLNETQRIALNTEQPEDLTDQPQLGSECVDVRRGDKRVSGDEACIVTLSSGEDTSMFCHPEQNICVKRCQSSTECPPSWECDTRPASTDVTDGEAFCVNPTCGAR